MKSFITVKSVSKSYYEVDILKNVSFAIGEGDLISLVGPFGCGKTTLMKILAGIIEDYEGSIFINDQTPTQARLKRRLGYSFQNAALLPWRDVLGNLTLPQEIAKVEDRNRIYDLLALTGLEYIARFKISQLSGGMRQLVNILRSLVLDPDILLLDEPFSSIDEASREKLHKQLLHIHNSTHKTTLLITHSLEEAVYLSDKVIVLSRKPACIKRILEINLDREDESVKYSKKFLMYIKLLRKELCSA